MSGREHLLRQFIAEEIASTLRHRLVNKISAIGALTFHLRRQLAEGETAASSVLPLIDAELSKASEHLGLRFVGPPVPAPALDLAGATAALLASLDAPGATIDASGGPVRASIDPGELDVAVFCLVENALEAQGRAGSLRIRPGRAERPEGRMAIVEVADEGPGLVGEARERAREAFFTTKPGHLGLGLNIAARIAQRWRGFLELEDALAPEGGLRARLVLPESQP